MNCPSLVKALRGLGLYVLLLSCLAQGLLCRGEMHHFTLYASTSSGTTREDVQEEDNTVFQKQENDLKGRPGQGYYIQMKIGQPPQKVNVLVDTGSSNFALATAPHPDITNYFNTSGSETFRDAGTEVIVPYTQGNWHGHLGTDVVTLTSLPNTTIRVNVACITSSQNFFINSSHWEGILGLAFADIARPDSSVTPFFETLVEQTGINNTFSMQLCGTMDINNTTNVQMGGTMTIGGIDESLYEGQFVYASIRREWYYEVILLDIAVAGSSLNLDCKEYNFDKTIVDSGTTNLRLPRTVYEAVKTRIRLTMQNRPGTPAVEGFFTGDKVLCWPENEVPWSDFPVLTLSLAWGHNSSVRLNVSPQQYLRAVREADSTSVGQDCFKFAITESDTGTVLGAIIMEGFYVVFDRDHKRIAFAKSTCQNRNPLAVTSDVKGPFPYRGDTWNCAYVQPSHDQTLLVTVAYVMAGICGIFIVPIVLMVIQWQFKRCRRRRHEVQDVSNLLKSDDDDASR